MRIPSQCRGFPQDITGWKLSASYQKVLCCKACDHAHFDRAIGFPIDLPVQVLCWLTGRIDVRWNLAQPPCVVELVAEKPDGSVETILRHEMRYPMSDYMIG